LTWYLNPEKAGNISFRNIDIYFRYYKVSHPRRLQGEWFELKSLKTL